MRTPSRRQVLAYTAAGLLVSGCAADRRDGGSTAAVTGGTAAPSATAAGPPDWKALAAQVKGRLLLPGNAGYDTARLTENPRYDGSTPLAVLSASSAQDVAAGVNFAGKYSVPLALRAGGHSYPGYSAGGGDGTGMPPSLVIDVRPLDAIDLHPDGTVRIGAGAALADVYSVIGGKGRALAAGSCATVGVTGLTLGGGVGVLVRAYGLTCDALTGVEIVTADGAVRTVSTAQDPDLFWACRGGGGGHLGVVTALTFNTVPAPQVTTFYLSWNFDQAAAVVDAWQRWAPGADKELWSTLKLLGGAAKHPNGPGIFCSGTWLGSPADLPGQLAGLLAAAAPQVNSSSTQSYQATMMSYAGCANIPVDQCHTGSGGALTREAFGATSHVPYQLLTGAGINEMLARVQSAQPLPGLREGGLSMDALGGAVTALGPADTAFVHRQALMSVQYTATFDDGADPAPFDAYVRGFRAAMSPYWGEGAYVNYADPSIADPNVAYFGANAAKLAAVKQRYDPAGRFSQPQGF